MTEVSFFILSVIASEMQRGVLWARMRLDGYVVVEVHVQVHRGRYAGLASPRCDLKLPPFQSSSVPAADGALKENCGLQFSKRIDDVLTRLTAYNMPSGRPNLTGFDHYKFIQAAGSPANDPWAKKCVHLSIRHIDMPEY